MDNGSTTISAVDLKRLRQQQGTKMSPDSVTPEVSARMNTVSTIDRAKTTETEVHHRNMLSFLGEHIMTPAYRSHQETLRENEGLYATPETGVVDKIGEYVRNAGYLWYTKTDTFKNDQKIAAEGAETTEVPEAPDTILGNMGTSAKAREMNPATERLSKLFNISSDVEKQGLNTLISYNNAQVMQELRDTVLTTLNIESSAPDLMQTMFGEREYVGATIADIMAENLFAAGIGNLMSGGEGISATATAYETLINTTQKVSGVDREEAAGIVDEWVASATITITGNAAEIGKFTREETARAQGIADPRGIIMKPMVVEPGRQAKEVYQSGITYPLVRAAAYAESALLNKAGAVVQMAELRHKMFDKVENPVVRTAFETVLNSIPGLGTGALSYADADTLETLKKELDPVTGSLSVFTPGVMETRAFRSMEAKKKGMGYQVLNEATEGAFDFACFLVEMWATRSIAMKTPLAPFISGKIGVGARMTERLSRTSPGMLTHLTAGNVLRATKVANTLRNAAFVGANRAMSTGGDFQTRAIAGLATAVYSATPASTAVLLNKIGYTGAGVVIPVLTDFISNSLITTGLFYYPEYQRQGGMTDDFMAAAIVQGMMDLGMAASTRAFMSSDRLVQTSMTRDGKYYDRVKEDNGGKSPINVLTGKAMSKDEYVTKKMQQRAKLESVQEVLDGLTRLYKEKATGDRPVDGDEAAEVNIKGYRDTAVSRFTKLEEKIAGQKDKLYQRLSDTIDKRVALEDKMLAQEKAEGGDTKKQLSALKSLETKTRNEIDVLERKGVPTDTEKPIAEPEGESQKSIDSRARTRLISLYKELKAVTKEEAKLTAEIDAKEGKGSKQLEKQRDELLNKIRNLQIERDAMLYTEGTPREVTLKEFERAQLESIDKQIKQFKEGLKAGTVITSKDITAFQKYLGTVIRTSTGLTDKQKLSMTNLLKTVKSGDKLAATLTKLWIRIDDLRTENTKTLFVEASDRLLKKAKKAVEKGKFDPDTAKAFIAAIKARKMQVTEVDWFGQSSAEMLLYDMSQLARLDLTAGQARAIYNDLVNIYNNGAATKAGMEAQRKARNENLVLAALTDIEGRDGPGEEMTRTQLKKADKTNFVKRIIQWNRRWGGLMTDLARRSETKKGQSVLERMTDMFAAENYAKHIKKVFNDVKADAYNKIYGLKNRYQIHKKTTQDLEATKEIYIETTKVDPKTKKETITPNKEEMSLTVMRQRWMEWQQSEGRARLRKHSGFTDKTMEEIEKVLDLDARNYDLIRELRLAYDKLYTEVNPVYRELEGKDLPYRENYSPFIPVKDNKNDPDINMIELMGGRITSSSVGNKAPLKELSGLSTLDNLGDVFIYDRYVSDMSHYIGFAKTVRDAQTIFRDSRVRAAITKRDGSSVLTNIGTHLDVFAAGKIEAAQNGAFSSIHKYISRMYAGSLFAQPKRTAIQMLSGMLYITEMPGKEMMAGILDLRRAWKSGELEVILNTDYMRERGINPSRDMKLASDVILEQQNVLQRKFIDNPRLTDVAGIFVKLGDRGGIMAGAWGLYRHYTKNLKMDKVAALERTMNFVNNTQQSQDLSQMSTGLMSGHPLIRLGSMYVHTPQQYFNNYWDALVSSGRISKGELAKTIAAYHAMAASYTFVQTAGKATAATLFTSFLAGPVSNGMPFIREGLSSIVGAVMANVFDEPKTSGQSMYPLQRWFSDIISVINMVNDIMVDGPDADSLVELARKMTDVSVPALGAAAAVAKEGMDVIAGARHYSDYNDFGYMLGKFAGYTDYQLEEK